MHPLLSNAIKYNIPDLLYTRHRFKRVSIIPYRNTYLRIDKSSEILGEGSLHLGIQWELGRYMPSQMVLRQHSKVILQGEFKIYSNHQIWINKNASLSLGSGSINNGLNLSCFEHIKIGHGVEISENLTIRDSDNHCIGDSQKTKPIVIGNKVWIGMNVTILKGVSVGDGAVIAAGALVNQNVPPRTLVAGIPAVVKKTDIEWKNF
ncbi:acyltransferase [Leptolyngbya cf. ectocarpi LEGE 11479]|uniref:Acyltransferase n=1 Tax=Leptolyngbya cf. ectocarpi LEGE 11479 TaxID=1828722 RepID=A0A928ZW53_LEPEC|nr:acyltransferase [Leptolyngbya ectocarpi]MBE9068561.1 acyltransferase [Leptolyngbya cf. ectocarpi LEGE 11479]